MHEEDRNKPTNCFLENVALAYDLTSAGMGVHLCSVKNMVSGKPLSDWEQKSIRTYTSNYLITPYILEWMHPGWYNGCGPKFESPRSQSSLKLLRENKAEYERLAFQTTRIFFEGEGSKTGIYNPEDIVRQVKQILFSERFKDALLKAATHKLGAMLAVSDQLAYDAYFSGTPIPYSFKPKGLDAEWKKMFDKTAPCFGDLYAEAHTVFTSVANPEDELVKYLFPLKRLSQLI